MDTSNAIAGPIIKITGVKTDTMQLFDEIPDTTDIITPSHSSSYYPYFPKPNDYIFLKVISSGTLNHSYSLIQSINVPLTFTITSTKQTIQGKVDILRIPTNQLLGTISPGEWFLTNPIIIRCWIDSLKVDSSSLNIKWNLK